MLFLLLALTPGLLGAQQASAQTTVNICGRTPEVEDGILRIVQLTDPSVTCSTVTAAQLAGITAVSNVQGAATAGVIEIVGYSSSTLRRSDFQGLTGTFTTIFIYDSPALQTVPADAFAELTRSSITGVKLPDNGIRSVRNGVFAGFTSVTAVDLGGNSLTSLSVDLFDGLTKLTDLRLDDNSLTTLEEDLFDGLAALKILFLSENSLTTLPVDLFNGLTALDELHLNDNSLTTLEEDLFDGLAALRILFLNDNSLTTLEEDLFDGLTALSTLRLDHNRLTTLHEDLLDGLTTLAAVYLRENQLTSLPVDVFDGRVGLLIIDLGNNSLTSLNRDLFDGLSAMLYLYLHGNELTSLPDDIFDGMSALDSLRLNGNELTSLPEDVFDGLTSLYALTLNGNELASLESGIFDGLTSLEILNLNDNELTSLPANVFDGPTALSALGLRRNRLGSLEADRLNPLTNLKTLLLSDNNLAALPVGVFSGPTQLSRLDLSCNALAPAGMPLGVYDPVASSMQSLMLNRNRFTAADAGYMATLEAKFIQMSFALDYMTTAPCLPAHDTGLISLSLSDVTLRPGFDRYTNDYNGLLIGDATQRTVEATPVDPGATVSYRDSSGRRLSDADGAASGFQVAAAEGSAIKVRVTAEDHRTTQDYTINFVAAGLRVPENIRVSSAQGRVKFTWDHLGVLEGHDWINYQIFMRNVGDTTWPVWPAEVANHNRTSAEVYGLVFRSGVRVEVGSTYEFAVRPKLIDTNLVPKRHESGPKKGQYVLDSDGNVVYKAGGWNAIVGPLSRTFRVTVQGSHPPRERDAERNADGSVTLSWQPPSVYEYDYEYDSSDPRADATVRRYNIYRSPERGKGCWKLIGSADSRARSYTDRSAEADRYYHYDVRAVGGGGESRPKAPLSIYGPKRSSCPSPARALSPIANFAVEAHADRVELSWDVGELGDASGYRVLRQAPGETTLTALADTAGGSYTDRGVAMGQPYLYAVAYVLDGETTLPTNSYGVFVPSPLLRATVRLPIANVAVEAHADRVELSWDVGELGDASGYRVLRQAPGETELSALADVANVGGYTDTEVAAGEIYLYAVAYVVDGEATGVTNSYGVIIPAAPSDPDGSRDGAEAIDAAAAAQSAQYYHGRSLDRANDDAVDYYSFTTTARRELGLGVRDQGIDLDVTLEDADGDVVARSWPPPGNPGIEWLKTVIEPGTYYVRVEAGEDGRTEYYLRFGLKAPPATPPAGPTGLTAVATADSVALSWTVPGQPQGVTVRGVYVERGGADGGFDLATQVTGPGSGVWSWTDTGVESGARYRYRVRLSTTAGEAHTDTVTATVTGAEAPLSSDASLSGLTLSGVDIGTFSSGTTSYAASVANGVAQTTVSATAGDGASYAVELNGVADADGTIDLAVGVNVITVEVTAEDGATTRTYTVTVTRAAAEALSADASLSALTLSGVDIGTFSSGTTSYAASVANGVAQTTVSATAGDGGASYAVKLNGVADADGTVELAVGVNVITVEVSAEDGVSTQTYTVTVTRAEAPLSSDATLSGLTLSGVDIGTFSVGTTSYTASVANGVAQTTVSASVNDAGASHAVKLGGVTDADGTVDLAVGANVITVEVSAEDGATTRTYTVTVTRAEASTPNTCPADGEFLGHIETADRVVVDMAWLTANEAQVWSGAPALIPVSAILALFREDGVTNIPLTELESLTLGAMPTGDWEMYDGTEGFAVYQESMTAVAFTGGCSHDMP